MQIYTCALHTFLCRAYKLTFVFVNLQREPRQPSTLHMKGLLASFLGALDTQTDLLQIANLAR